MFEINIASLPTLKSSAHRLKILFLPVICTLQQEAAVRSTPADASVIAQDILLHHNARLKLYLYLILIDDPDALDQPPDEVIVKLPFQVSGLFQVALHILRSLFVRFSQLYLPYPLKFFSAP